MDGEMTAKKSEMDPTKATRVMTRAEKKFCTRLADALDKHANALGISEQKKTCRDTYLLLRANKAILKRPRYQKLRETAKNKLKELLPMWQDGGHEFEKDFE